MNKEKLNLKDFLTDILENPGRIHECFRYFKNYSLKNQALASMQLYPKIEPINTYKGWQDLGRQVKNKLKTTKATTQKPKKQFLFTKKIGLSYQILTARHLKKLKRLLKILTLKNA